MRVLSRHTGGATDSADDAAQERMVPHLKDLRLPPAERARPGARSNVFASRAVNRVFGQLMAEGGLALLNPKRIDREALQMLSRVQIGRIVDELEAAVRRELGADDILLGLRRQQFAGAGRPRHARLKPNG